MSDRNVAYGPGVKKQQPKPGALYIRLSPMGGQIVLCCENKGAPEHTKIAVLVLHGENAGTFSCVSGELELIPITRDALTFDGPPPCKGSTDHVGGFLLMEDGVRYVAQYENGDESDRYAVNLATGEITDLPLTRCLFSRCIATWSHQDIPKFKLSAVARMDAEFSERAPANVVHWLKARHAERAAAFA